MSTKVGLWEHFRKLASLKGREDRASFWPYAALVVGIVLVAGSVMILPMVARSMRAMPEITVADPDNVTFTSDLGEFAILGQDQAPGLMPSASFLAAYLAVTLGLALLLYAAAVVRRLHDRGKSGAWGLMPLPFLAYTSIQVIRLFGSMNGGDQPNMTVFITIAFSNILYWITLLTLIVLLAGASDPEPNRFDFEG